MYDANKASAVKVAEPIAKPFPIAAVVLPTESKRSVLSLTFGSNPDISAIPPALSAIGPYAAIAKVIPKVANIPTAAKAIPNNPNKLKDTTVAIAINITGIAVDSIPSAIPFINKGADPEVAVEA